MKRAALFIIVISAISILSATLSAGYARAEDELSAAAEPGSREPASAKAKKDSTAKQIDSAFPAPTPTPQPYYYPSAQRPAPAQQAPREFDRAIDAENPPEPKGLGIQLQVYYDPLMIAERFNPTGTQGQYSYQNTTGVGGMQLMFARINRAHFEFTSGIDYMFTENVQNQQTIPIGNYLVNGQTFNLMGVKVLQIGYRFAAGPFTVVPYSGVGVYYGKNAVTIANLGLPAGSNTDTVTYSKLIGTWNAGARLDFDFNKARTFAAGVALELTVPFKIADSLSQSGSVQNIQAGYESNLQNSLDFMNSVSGRVVGTVAVYF